MSAINQVIALEVNSSLSSSVIPIQTVQASVQQGFLCQNKADIREACYYCLAIDFPLQSPLAFRHGADVIRTAYADSTLSCGMRGHKEWYVN